MQRERERKKKREKEKEKESVVDRERIRQTDRQNFEDRMTETERKK